jgi:Sigma-70, region 4
MGAKPPAARVATADELLLEVVAAEVPSPEIAAETPAPASASWQDPFDLGSEPNDPLILDLVTGNPTSVRLRNAVVVAHDQDTLPFKRVSDYTAAGRAASERMIHKVANFGRKSAAELEHLMAQVDLDRPVAPVVEVDQLRIELAERFDGVTVEEVLFAGDPPARLLPGLKHLDLGDAPLSALLLDFPIARTKLQRLPNMGRTSIAALRAIVGAYIGERFTDGGLDPDQIDDANALLLDGAHLAPNVRRSLSDALSGRIEALIEGSDEVSRARDEQAEPVQPPAALIYAALETLPPRTRDILERRFGLLSPPETLDEVGQIYGVTRERIRQIEAKSIRLLKQRSRRRLSRSVLEHGEVLWSVLVGDRTFLLERDLPRLRRSAPGAFMLALEVSDMDLEGWLSSYAQAFESGWVAPGVSVSELVSLADHMHEALRSAVLPCALAQLVPITDLDTATMVATLIGRRLYAGYLVKDRLGRRLRRALGLHALLAEEGDPVQVNELVSRYRSIATDDSCGARDAEIVMQAQDHLFLEVTEGTWAALGAGGVLSASTLVDREAMDFALDAEDEDLALEAASLDDGQTVAEAIESELRRAGPMRISDIIDRAPAYLPAGRSSNSVGPILLNTKDRFVRALPGVYALHDQLPSPAGLLAAPPAYIFEQEQVRIYALARRGGEPYDAFPLWLPETEYLWCVWAKQNAPPPLLESLLAIARIETWPHIDDRDVWTALVAERGRFAPDLLQPLEGLSLPELERVFAACRFLQKSRRMSWISANRVLLRRLTDHTAGGLLATLIAIGALSGDSPDWQAEHLAGPALNAITRNLERARLAEGRLRWDGRFGVQLRESAAQRPQVGSGWLTADDANALLGADVQIGASPLEALDPLELLLAERAKALNAQAVQETFRQVSAGE